MSLLEKVLLQVPPEWEQNEYRNVRYVLQQVNQNTDEYKEIEHFIKTEMHGRKVLKIMRVQHPYAYGRYLLKKQQAEKYSKIIRESREIIYVTNESYVDKLLEFNCDNRRRGMTRHYCCSYDCIIIIRKLITACQVSDSDVYPQYYVKLKPVKDEEEEDLSASALSVLLSKQTI